MLCCEIQLALSFGNPSARPLASSGLLCLLHGDLVLGESGRASSCETSVPSPQRKVLLPCPINATKVNLRLFVIVLPSLYGLLQTLPVGTACVWNCVCCNIRYLIVRYNRDGRCDTTREESWDSLCMLRTHLLSEGGDMGRSLLGKADAAGLRRKTSLTDKSTRQPEAPNLMRGFNGIVDKKGILQFATETPIANLGYTQEEVLRKPFLYGYKKLSIW